MKHIEHIGLFGKKTKSDEIEKACPISDVMIEGKVSFSKESTIIDCTSEEMKIEYKIYVN